MKRLLAALMLILLPFSVVSCAEPIVKSGIENFSYATCSLGLTSNLFPSEDYLTAFEYEEADYAYYDSCDLVWGYAKAFAYFRYSEEEYKKAKEHSLNTVSLNSNQYESSGYYFSEYLCYESKDENGEWIAKSQFPEQFNMVGYNDDKCILVFIGYYNGNPEDSEIALAKSDFGTFLTTVYSEYFNFER